MSNPTMTAAARRKPVQRLFTGLAGSALSVVQEPKKSAAAIRGEQFRQRQKANSEYAKKEAERKKQERAETKRTDEINDILATPPDGAKLQLSADEGETIPKGQALIVLSGGAKELELQEGLNRENKFGRKVRPSGASPATDEDDDDERKLKVVEAPTKYTIEGRKLREFIYSHVSSNNAHEYVCRLCEVVIGPVCNSSDVEIIKFEQAVVDHFDKIHGKVYRDFLEKAGKKKKVCGEDHAGMIERHGKGTLNLVCKKCKKVLWKPPKQPVARPVQPIRKTLVKRGRRRSDAEPGVAA